MSLKLLICDDEPYIRMLLEQTLEDLEDEGVELLVGKNGEEGLNLILEHLPQLVFMDVMMPKMSGFEVCKTVKLDKQIENVHIVLLTAKGQELDREKGLSMGADNYITKPFDPDSLYEYACEQLGIED